MAYNPENLEAPNRTEKQPPRQVNPETARKLGEVAVKGTRK